MFTIDWIYLNNFNRGPHNDFIRSDCVILIEGGASEYVDNLYLVTMVNRVLNRSQ